MPLDFDILNMLIPVMVVTVPAFLVYSMIGGKVAFVGGAVIGVAIGTSAGILENWVIVLAIIALASVLFLENGGAQYIEEAV